MEHVAKRNLCNIFEAMVRTKKIERIYLYTKSSANITLSIVQAAHKTIAMEHGLNNFEVAKVIYLLLDIGILQLKSIRRVDSLFVEKSKEHDLIESLK